MTRFIAVALVLAAAEAVLWRTLILRYGDGGGSTDLSACATVSLVALGLPVAVGYLLGRRLGSVRRAISHGAFLGVAVWGAVWETSARYHALESSDGFLITAAWLLFSGLIAALVGAFVGRRP